jgi:thiol-disulfide isomerase/thioredoxin
MRYMAGAVRGKELLLSTFDGIHAYLVRAELRSDSTLEGVWLYPAVWEDRFTATPVQGPFDRSQLHPIGMKPGENRVSIPQLDKPRYQGNPVIVDLMGTWCSACLDATPFLVELYEEYHRRGVEFLTLAFEATTNEAHNREQVQRYVEHYGIDWPVIPIGGTLEQLPDQFPPELDNTGGLPVTIFIRRDGTVAGVSSGFISAAAEEEQEKFHAQLRRWAREIASSSYVRLDGGHAPAE